MKIVGCDSHTRYQQIAMLDAETGELIERRLERASGEARAFYAELEAPVRVEGSSHRPAIVLSWQLWDAPSWHIPFERRVIANRQKQSYRCAIGAVP